MGGITPNSTGVNPGNKTEIILDMIYGLTAASIAGAEDITAVAAEDTVTLLTYALVIERDEATGVTTFTYYDGDGNLFVPVNPMRIVPSTGSAQYATGVQYVEGNIGMIAMAVRNDDIAINAGNFLTTNNNDFSPIATNEFGVVFTYDVSVLALVTSIDTRLSPPLSYSSAVYENAEVVSATLATLYGITGYNSGPAQFIQVHNTSTLPADTAVPMIIFAVAAASNFFWNPSNYGWDLTTGLTICNSTTGPTKTIGAADCWFNVQYK